MTTPAPAPTRAFAPFRPLYDQIVVMRDAPPKMIGSIHVPDTVQEKMRAEGARGIVVAVGPGRYKQEKRKHDVWPGGEGRCARCGEFPEDAETLCGKLADTSEREPVDVKIGDIVYFAPRSAEVEIELEGVKYSVMWDDEAQAIEEYDAYPPDAPTLAELPS